MTAFEEMGVLPEIARAIEEQEWLLPTDVQAEAIPLILGGGDVLMAAETGSGKTGAFCLPILQVVWETLRDTDSGKNTSGGESGHETSSSHWALSLFDRSHAMAVTPNGLRCQSRNFHEWHGCRANKGVEKSGKYYYEATVTDEGLCRVGWSTIEASLDLGTDKFGYGYGGTGKKSNAKQFDNYGEAFGKCDVIGCLLDLDNGEIKFTKNGVDLGSAFVLNNKTKTQTFFPAVVLKNAEMSFNFGNEPFKYGPPTNYIAISAVTRDCLKENRLNTSKSQNVRGDVKPPSNAPQAIIIEPSRELAEQTYNQLNKFKTYVENPKIHVLLVVGGTAARNQIAALHSGVNIVVGTPGRLEDFIKGGHVSLTHCRFFVLDEADDLLKKGYIQFIDSLYEQIPKMSADGKRMQMIVCSATCHAFEVKKMADRLMHFPTWVDLKGEDVVPETVHHVVVMIDPQQDKSWYNLQNHITTDGVHMHDNVRPGSNTAESLSEAAKILKAEYCIRAIRTHKMYRAIIFCRTKIDCDNLERYFIKTDYNRLLCVCLHGDRKPQERRSNLDRFKRQDAYFLICTDVAARGLDIAGVPFLINMTLPDDASDYVHRIGRVGRAERMGLAISLVSRVPEKVWYHGHWCPSRGRDCNNTNLTNENGCCIWYNESKYLADIEDHLNVTIQQVGSDIVVPSNEFDGKVVYGKKMISSGSNYKNHVQQMAPVVEALASYEANAQLMYLKRQLL